MCTDEAKTVQNIFLCLKPSFSSCELISCVSSAGFRCDAVCKSQQNSGMLPLLKSQTHSPKSRANTSSWRSDLEKPADAHEVGFWHTHWPCWYWDTHFPPQTLCQQDHAMRDAKREERAGSPNLATVRVALRHARWGKMNLIEVWKALQSWAFFACYQAVSRLLKLYR